MKLRNVFVVVFFPVFIRSCVGFCEDPSEIRFDFTKIETTVSENAFAENIFIDVSISDTSDYFYYGAATSIHGFGFTNAYGLSCIDPYYFVPNQKITDIRVVTLYDISPSFPSGTDVSGYFYARDFLYYSLEDLVGKLSQDEVYWQRQSGFTVFLKERVENNMARFRVEIKFSDGRSLADTTNIINILSN